MTNTTTAALTRYEAIIRRPRTALAYTATAVRLEIAAKSESGERARKLLDRAADCRARAARVRAARCRASGYAALALSWEQEAERAEARIA